MPEELTRRPYTLWLTEAERDALKQHMLVAAEVSPDPALRRGALAIVRLIVPATAAEWIAGALPILADLAEQGEALDERYRRAHSAAFPNGGGSHPSELSAEHDRTVYVRMAALRAASRLVKSITT